MRPRSRCDVTPNIEYVVAKWLDLIAEITSGYTTQSDEQNAFRSDTAHWRAVVHQVDVLSRQRRRCEMKAFPSSRLLAVASAVLTLALLVPASAYAQLNGGNILGDTGVDSGTQPPPGFWVGGFYYRYYTDQIRKADGSKLTIDPSQRASGTFPGAAPTFLYISTAKILGANYGALVAPTVMRGALEAPGFGLDREIATDIGDTYIVPLQLGWHLPQADFVASAGAWVPTGRYTAGAFNNTGKGMWSWEAAGGSTLFLDPRRTWSVATTAFYETHSKKTGGAIAINDSLSLGDVTVGDILSLEGGLAREFAGGLAHAGVAYYAQWKVTDDTFTVSGTMPGFTGFAPPPNHRVFGLGPDVTIPIGNKSMLFFVVNARYFWELGAEVKTQGQSLIVSASVPVPSLKSK